MREDGEPISRGQLDRRAAEEGGLRNALVGAALFGGVVLVGGVLGILFLELLQAVGWWEAPASEGALHNNQLVRLAADCRLRPELAPAEATTA